ncbi:MAG: hypothetical protein EOO43_14245 [Flavobacterium sp.]|nr:MAG: hypothetical protein EOO43_14245 [Flavobacterium sp.]
MLNINRLSKLYEVYNLYRLIDGLRSCLSPDHFQITSSTTREDELIDRISFSNSLFTVRLYYEPRYYQSDRAGSINLRRIDRNSFTTGSYYCPDFVIEISNNSNNDSKFYVLDAKYSKVQTVRNLHLMEVVKKYVLNTGVSGKKNAKINELTILFPGDTDFSVVASEHYEPNIRAVASKPGKEGNLNIYVRNIMARNIPLFLMVPVSEDDVNPRHSLE